MKRWVIADTHFGHQMLIDEGHRPAGYDQRIIKQWCALVANDDLIIHLGDVALPDSNQAVWDSIRSVLPGRKVLVMGNHDKRSAKWYMERGFAFACDAFELRGILYTHRPNPVIPAGIRFNIHGHLHSGEHRAFEALPQHRLVSLEETSYAPVQVDKVAR
jgi:calcineurin-like phosphoesterase family protein